MEKRIAAYRGCLLGLAVGDAMGYTVDNKSWDEICADYGPNGLLGYDLVNGTADISSYTQLCAFMCNGLMLGAIRANPELLPRYMAMSLREWAKSQQFRGTTEKTNCWLAQVPEMRRRHCMDTRMLDALSRDTFGTPEKPVFRSTTPAAITTAVAVGLGTLPANIEAKNIGALGAQAVAFTHGDPDSFLAGAFVAYAVAGILQQPDDALSTHFNRAIEAVNLLYGEKYPETEAVLSRIRRAMELTKDAELTTLAAMTLLGCTTASECVAGAVYASMIHMSNFDEGMIAAVNHSGRSAAVGALTGAFLGARLGADALPEFYLESLEPAMVLCELADDLTQAKIVMRIFDDSWDTKYVQGMPAK